MDDAFSFHAPAEVLRRRVDPRLLRTAVLATLVVTVTVAFGRWVVESERASDRRAASSEAAAPVPATVPAEAAPADDAAAQDAAATSLTIARDLVADGRALADIGPALLAEEQPDLIFVDGPSTTPAIVSVAGGPRTWAAAVMGPTGTCFWVKTTAAGLVRYGTGPVCTGEAATAAAAIAW
jgi:hypothetical protein